MHSTSRRTGVEALGDLSLGSHICLFYDNAHDLMETLALYFTAGLVNHELCLWITPESSANARERLERAVSGANEYLEAGNIEILSSQEWFYNGDIFDADQALQCWDSKLKQALDKGYARMRGLADLSWLGPEQWKAFVDFEGQLNERFAGKPINIVCAYPTATRNAADILDIARTHQFVAAKRSGQWEILEAPQLKHIKAEPRSDEREHRIEKHSAHLTQINQALQAEIIEHMQTEEALRESERKLKEAETLAHIGYWERDILADRITWSEGTSRILGRQPPHGGISQANLQEFIFPDDLKIHLEVLSEALQGNAPYDVEYRIVRPDGEIRFVHVRDQAQHDDSGRVIRMFGAVQDITERKRAEEAARESQDLVRLVLATLPVGVMVVNRDDDIILVNEASKRIWGGVIIPGLERRTQSVGSWHDSGRRIVPTEWASVRALSDGETTLNERIDIETFDGQQKTILNSAAPIRNAGGLIIGAVIVNEDISGRVQAEEAKKRQAARAETLARIAARLNRHLDLNAVVQAVCQEIVDTFKVSQAAMSLYDEPSDLLVYAGGVNILPELASAIEPTSRARFDALLQELGPIMVVPDIQAVPDAPNAEFNAHLDVRTVVTVAMLRDGDLIGVVAFGINGGVREFTQDELSLLKAISDQAAQALANAQLLKAANEQQEQLRALSAKLVDAQEEERLAVARDLHDDIGQALTGLVMQLGSARSLLSRSAKAARDILEQAEALTQEVLERTRAMIHELRPQVLDDLGLIPALQRIGDDFQRSTGVQVEVRMSSFPQRLPPAAEVAVFRIVQEALTNVRKHSQARHARIELTKQGEELLLSVQDDGIGFEKQPFRPQASGDVVIGEGHRIPAGHYGLIGIQERATMLGGELQVTTGPGQGTTLRVALPLAETKDFPHEDL